MEALVNFFENFGQYILAIETVLVALIALFVLIPGPQPEKSLQAIVDFIKKFSKK